MSLRYCQLIVKVWGYQQTKRRFNYLRGMNYNIYCLQDTHFTPEKENDIRNMWDFNCFFSSFSSNSRGIAILFSNNFDVKVHKEKGDVDGNYLMLDFTTEEKRLLLCCLYGPNNDNPAFYEKLQENINGFKCENVILCGDFNLVLKPNLDYFNYKHINNPNARQRVIELMEDNNFVTFFVKTIQMS